MIDTSEGQVQLTRCGSGKQVVVLIHHAPASSACWSDVLPALAARAACAWAVDLPGYGGSDPPPLALDGAGTDLYWYADRIAEVIATAGTPVVLVGRQTGAAVAAAVAVRRPELVRALVLWGYPDFDDPLRSALATETTPELGGDLQPLRRFVADLRGHDPRAAPGAAGADEYVRRALADYCLAGSAQHWAHNAVGRADLTRLAGSVTQSALVVYDLAASGFEAQKAATRRVLRHLRHAELLDMPGLTSSLPPAQAASFAEAVLAFAAGASTLADSDPQGDA